MDDFVAEVSRTVGHQTVGDIESDTPLNDGGGGVLGVVVEVCKEPLVVRMVTTKHKYVLVACLSRPEPDVVKLQQVVGLCAVEGQTERKWDLSPVQLSIESGCTYGRRHGRPRAKLIIEGTSTRLLL